MVNKLDIMTVEAEQYKNDYAGILSEVESYYETAYEGKVALSDMDVYAIGKYTKTVETYAPYMNESDVSGLGNLGDALKDNLGLTATQYATSIIPLLASVQPTEQELAIVYFKSARATTSRGGVNTGDELLSRFGKTSESMDDYISDEQTNSTVTVDPAVNGPYVINLLGPVRKGTINISIEGTTAIDNGDGMIFGSNIDPTASSIDYDNAVLTIQFVDASSFTLGSAIETAYTQLVFSNDVISGFKYDINSEAIPVNYYPLQITYDVVGDFVTRRQFGQAVSDFAGKDLIYQINKALSGGLIKKLKIAAIKNEAETGTTLSWAMTPPAGTSLIEHRRTFSDIYDLAISGMEEISGLGGISAVIVGQEGRKIYNALGIGQTKSKPGAYVIGFDGEVVIIYASKDYVAADEALLIHKGDFFETSSIYAPFLPIMTVTTQGRDHNVFQNSKGAATGAGMKVINRGFVQRVKLTA